MEEVEPRNRLLSACLRALEVGAIPFEVVVGCPASVVLPRITFAAPKHRRELARALGLDDHPWGPPDTIGVRLNVQGEVTVRGYHRMARIPEEVDVPADLRPHLRPLMAALWPEPEVYGHWAGQPTWEALHEAGERSLSLTLPRPEVRPVGHRGYLGISLRTEKSGGTSLTAYADHTALPPDDEIREGWSASLPATERDAFERALAAVRSLGPRQGGSWFDFLAWGVDSTHRSWRAVSLRTPWSYERAATVA
ncbi:MAG: hypothetical protein AAF799_08265 [Myxococcota bacterium]